MLFLSVLLFFSGVRVLAFQPDIPLKRTHPLSTTGSTGPPALSAVTGTLHVVVVRVEFRADSNRFTSGDGTFGAGGLPYLNNERITIDPLPHDRSYFEAHLEFAKNYFEKISANRLTVEYRVLPALYKLDQKMEHYAPTGSTFTNEKLAELSHDVWGKVEANGGFDATGLDPQNTLFIIFHAGAGRDIALTGTMLDKTPQDIPSIYLGQQALSELLGEPDFSGFPVNNGSFRIPNSLIMPQTLSRRGEDVGGNEFVLQLSLNGLLCAGIGSHLGLPDLFNTKDGSSGIGRFGLMDGASIFSYSGLFPPEPSAWEKQFLGWVTPFDIDPDSPTPIPLAAASLRQQGNSVARYLISSDEYFLVENRHRDPSNNGAILTIRKNDGTEVQMEFSNTDETFVLQGPGFEELFAGNAGVVVNVDNFDWSLPGGIASGSDGITGTPDDQVLNGGILIWHIDEGVIKRGLAGQGVNSDPDRRGVDLEEADGAQDIGRPAQTLGADRTNGTAFDFWWRGNNASVITREGDTLSLYDNRFAPDTHPDNRSNSGAPSFFEFYDFSDIQTVATFKTRRSTGGPVTAVPLPVDTLPGPAFTPEHQSYWSRYPLSLSLYRAENDTFLVVPTGQTVYALQVDSPIGSLFDFGVASPQQPYVDEPIVLGNRTEPDGNGTDLEAWSWDGASWQNLWSATGAANSAFLSSPDGSTLVLDFTDDRFDLSGGTQLPDLAVPQQRSAMLDSRFSFLTPGELRFEGTQNGIPLNAQPGNTRLYTGALQLTSTAMRFYLLEDNSFYLVDPDSPQPAKLLFESSSLEWPALSDYDQDGRLDFLFVDRASNQLKAVNSNGAFLHSFPIPAPRGSRFIGTPLIADLEGDRSLDLIISVQDSISLNLYAYNSEGKIKPGFPLYVGSITDSVNQPVHAVIGDKTLYAVSHAGDLKAWEFARMTNVSWSSRYGNEPFNKVTGRISGSGEPASISSILVASETYNWPNPAGEETYIRYQTSGPGKVEIKIITLSGQVLFDRNLDVSGGSPEEHRISTAQWGSGIYLAKVTATIAGRKASKIIKIAVVH